MGSTGKAALGRPGGKSLWTRIALRDDSEANKRPFYGEDRGRSVPGEDLDASSQWTTEGGTREESPGNGRRNPLISSTLDQFFPFEFDVILYQRQYGIL